MRKNIVNDKKEDRPSGGVRLYSDRLLGLRSECNIGGCREWETSTGWIYYDIRMEQWFIEFKCRDHGKGSAWHRDWQSLIDEVIATKAIEGISIPNAIHPQPDKRKEE